MVCHGNPPNHKESRDGFYVYKNDRNDNGRVIKIKNSPKSITYSIFNFYNNEIDFDPRNCLAENKRTFKKDGAFIIQTVRPSSQKHLRRKLQYKLRNI